MTILLRQKPLARVVMGIVTAANGAWFDPSDLSTLYQDAAGTTPVTAVEQPVGLMLDKSRGLMLGPEVTPWANGFSSLTGVTPVDATRELVGSEIITTATQGSSDRTEYALTGLTIGKTYKIKIKARRGTGVTQNFNLWTFCSISLTNITQSTTKDYEFNVVATSTSGVIRVYANAASGGSIGDSVIVSSISVRELYGYHATQPITASRPTLSARKNVLLATETLATQSVTTLSATYTLSFTGTGSVTLSGTSTGTLTGTGTNRVSLTFTPTAGTLTLTVSGSVTKAQVELGATSGPYQRVNTATDYDTDERYFPKFLRFDGVDDYLNLPYMGLYAAGSASVVVGISTTSMASFAMLLSERSITDTNPVWIPIRNKGSGLFGVLIRTDTSSTILDSSGLSNLLNDGITKALSVIDTGSSVNIYSNGSNAQNTPYTRSAPLTTTNTTVGASISTTNSGFFGGSLYGLIITKSALTDSQRVTCERYLGRKSGVML